MNVNLRKIIAIAMQGVSIQMDLSNVTVTMGILEMDFTVQVWINVFLVPFNVGTLLSNLENIQRNAQNLFVANIYKWKYSHGICRLHSRYLYKDLRRFFGLDILNGDTDCMPDESQDVTWQRTVAGNIRTYPCPKEHLGKKKLGVEEKIQGLPKKSPPTKKMQTS